MTDNADRNNESAPTAEQAVEAADKAELSRYRSLPWLGNAWLLIAAISSMLTSIYVIFGLGNELSLYVPLETEYFYFMIAVLLPLPFLIYPTGDPRAHAMPWLQVLPAGIALAVPAYFMVKLWNPTALQALGATGDAIVFLILLFVLSLPYYLRERDDKHVPWFDVLLAVVSFVLAGYFTIKGNAILEIGWEYDAPEHAKFLAFVLWALILEATRRAGGTAIFVICLIVSIYPMVSNFAPGFLHGEPVTPEITVGFHMFGTESVLGIPMNAFANLVVGFLIFGVALQYTGGGAFFLNLAFALLGKHRGGPAKVAIFSSGLMGSMSGSVITNVLTTGVMTIPAMKRVGFRPAYAGGVEACASTGGVLMPPVMGATAFVMATFLEIPYSEIVIAAAFPSIFYYLGLYLQIDAYAARNDLQGLPESELPPITTVLREGWYFIAVFIALIIMLLYMQREAQAPYYATAVLLIINQFSKGTSLGLGWIGQFRPRRRAAIRRTDGDPGRRWPDHRCVDPDWQSWFDHLRADAVRSRQHAALVVHGGSDELCPRHRDDDHGRLPLPGGHGRACTDAGWIGQTRGSFVPDVLGYDLVHHSAGRDRRIRCRHRRQGSTHEDRVRGDAAR